MVEKTEIDDGGFAFPFNEKNDDGTHYHSDPGMTLRDWFAGRAMQGMLASQGQGGEFFKAEAIVSDAWDFADRMIAARKGG